MLTQRGLRKSMTSSSVLRSIARGAIGGVLFGILFNYGRRECLMPVPDMREVYKTIRVVFVAPAGVNAAQNKLLASENDIYGDVLQTNVDFQEKNYETLMILSGHQWCIENIGSRSEYFVNVDRSAFPFLPNLYEYTAKSAENPDFSSTIHCGSKIVDPLHKPRDPLSKYYVKRRIYSESYFPSYCDPSIVIMPQSVMKDLYNTAMVTKIDAIPQGDVFVWGILREKLRSGGKKNIIDAPKTIKNESLTPLWYRVDFASYKASKDVERLWENTKERFTFLKDASVEGKKRRAVLVDIPRSDTKKSPESDMKTFVYKWARVSMIREKSKTS